MEWVKIGPAIYNLCIIIILGRAEGTRKNTGLLALSASPWILADALPLLMKPKEKPLCSLSLSFLNCPMSRMG